VSSGYRFPFVGSPVGSPVGSALFLGDEFDVFWCCIFPPSKATKYISIFFFLSPWGIKKDYLGGIN
jgi:hypothetical protein